MATGQATKLTGAVGEFLVAAELCRRGLLATPFAGNVPHYDIIASGQSGGHVAVQVKAINGHAWQFDIRKFLDVQMDEDGKRQVLGAPRQEPFPELMCVLVVLKKTGQYRFFILKWKELQNLVVRDYTRDGRAADGAAPLKGQMPARCFLARLPKRKVALKPSGQHSWGTPVGSSCCYTNLTRILPGT